ncbi:MAG: hypothetical protein WAU32_01560 [Thermoanaerobaculia bacterium]|jgi:hypothetical protein
MSRKLRVVLIGLGVAVLNSTLAAPPAGAIPAFARKYGLRCTACHESWPKLNDFGRAFRDNGYQILTGKDDTVTASPAYWPVSIRLTPHYEFDEVTNQSTDQGVKKLRTGGFAAIGMDLLTAGTLFQDVSFLVVPTGFAPDGAVSLESAWVRLDNLWKSSWINLKVGRHEVDLPASAHRPWNLSSTGYLIYGFHASGSVSLFDMGTNQWGIEYGGHDRGSLNRVTFSVFNVQDSPGSRNFFSTPGIYGHATHEWAFDEGVVSAVKVGAFGSYTTWPTTFFTSGGTPIPGTGGNLEPSMKIGGEGQIWFGPRASPFHLILVFAHGSDNQALIPNATQDGIFNGGFAEFGYSIGLKNLIFGRYDICKNSRQGDPTAPSNLNDQNAITVGYRHTFQFSNRAEYALHIEYSSLQTKGAGANGLDMRANTYFAGIDFAY